MLQISAAEMLNRRCPQELLETSNWVTAKRLEMLPDVEFATRRQLLRGNLWQVKLYLYRSDGTWLYLSEAITIQQLWALRVILLSYMQETWVAERGTSAAESWIWFTGVLMLFPAIFEQKMAISKWWTTITIQLTSLFHLFCHVLMAS